jgi:hypothetical protein
MVYFRFLSRARTIPSVAPMTGMAQDMGKLSPFCSRDFGTVHFPQRPGRPGPQFAVMASSESILKMALSLRTSFVLL